MHSSSIAARYQVKLWLPSATLRWKCRATKMVGSLWQSYIHLEAHGAHESVKQNGSQEPWRTATRHFSRSHDFSYPKRRRWGHSTACTRRGKCRLLPMHFLCSVPRRLVCLVALFAWFATRPLWGCFEALRRFKSYLVGKQRTAVLLSTTLISIDIVQHRFQRPVYRRVVRSMTLAALGSDAPPWLPCQITNLFTGNLCSHTPNIYLHVFDQAILTQLKCSLQMKRKFSQASYDSESTVICWHPTP